MHMIKYISCYIKEFLYLFNILFLMEEDNQQEKHDEQEKYRNLQCRMYENEYPKPNELVLVSYNIIK